MHIVGFFMRLWKEILNTVKVVVLKSYEKNSNFVTAESLSLKVNMILLATCTMFTDFM